MCTLCRECFRSSLCLRKKPGFNRQLSAPFEKWCLRLQTKEKAPQLGCFNLPSLSPNYIFLSAHLSLPLLFPFHLLQFMSCLGFTQGLPGSEGYISASWNLSWRYITDPHSRCPLHCWTNLPWKTHQAWYLVTGRLNGKHLISIQWLCEHSETSFSNERTTNLSLQTTERFWGLATERRHKYQTKAWPVR